MKPSRRLAEHSGRTIAAALSAVAALAWAPPARSYCRSLTEAPPSDWREDLEGACWTGEGRDAGEPMLKYQFWQTERVAYSIQQNASQFFTFAEVTAAADAAFQTWVNASCATGGTPSIAADDQGAVACDVLGAWYEGEATQHPILFRDDAWDPALPSTVGYTKLQVKTSTGEVRHAGIEIDTSESNHRNIVVNDPIPTGGYRLQSVLLHEIGHFLGLGHSEKTTAVMYAFYEGEPVLTDDDIEGICAIYPPSSPPMRMTSDGLITATSESQPFGGFSTQCASADGGTSTVAGWPTEGHACAVAHPGGAPWPSDSTRGPALAVAVGMTALARWRPRRRARIVSVAARG